MNIDPEDIYWRSKNPFIQAKQLNREYQNPKNQDNQPILKNNTKTIQIENKIKTSQCLNIPESLKQNEKSYQNNSNLRFKNKKNNLKEKKIKTCHHYKNLNMKKETLFQN